MKDGLVLTGGRRHTTSSEAIGKHQSWSGDRGVRGTWRPERVYCGFLEKGEQDKRV